MSLGILVKGSEGLVLAAESRVTLQAKDGAGNTVVVSFDNAVKVLSFNPPHTFVGAVTYGQAAIGLRTAHSFVPELEASLPSNRLKVEEYAQRMSDFYAQQWKAAMPMPPAYSGPPMVFVVGGFDDGEPYGRVYVIEVPTNLKPVQQNPKPEDFGVTWGGQREIVDRLVQGFDERALQVVATTLSVPPARLPALRDALKRELGLPIPLPAMALQDCIDLAVFFIRTTITGQKLTVGIRGCGGPIDVATITRSEGLRFIQRKQPVGEVGG